MARGEGHIQCALFRSEVFFTRYFLRLIVCHAILNGTIKAVQILDSGIPMDRLLIQINFLNSFVTTNLILSRDQFRDKIKGRICHIC